MNWKKALVSGIVAAIVLIALGFVFSMLYPAANVWYMEVFANMNMTMMWVSTFLLGLFMGIVFSVVGSAVPGTGWYKGINYGVMVWLLAGLMWPVMALGWAPINITIFDLATGLIMYAFAGAALALVYERV